MNKSRINQMKKSRKILILSTTCLGSALVTMNNGSLNIALLTIVDEFQTSLATASWIITSFMVSMTLFLLYAGKVSDLFGRKKTYIIGIVIFISSAYIAGFTHSIEGLIITRIFQGIGGAIIMSSSVPIVTDIFSKNNRGVSLGIVAMSLAIGSACGPIIGGLILWFSWHWIFWVNVPIFILILIIVQFFFTDTQKSSRKHKFDFMGTVILLIFLLVILFIFTYALPNEWDVLIIIFLTSLSAICLYIFVVIEKRAVDPIIQTDLFKNKIYMIANLGTFSNSLGQTIAMFIMIIYLQSLKGFSPFEASLILIPIPLLLAIAGPISGKLADRIGSGLLSSTGLLLLAIGLGMVSFVHLDTTIFYILISLCMIGLGSGIFQAPNTRTIMNIAPSNHRGVVAATRSMLNSIGRLIAVSVSVGVLGIVLPDEGMSLPRESVDAFLLLVQYTLWGTALICLATSLFTWFIEKKGIRDFSNNHVDERKNNV
jgi:EmrB/QacA subfamily drug resistance transporter